MLKKNNVDGSRIIVRNFRVNVTNTGSMAGDDVVLAFIAPPQLQLNGQAPPIKKLFGIEIVFGIRAPTVYLFFLGFSETQGSHQTADDHIVS